MVPDEFIGRGGRNDNAEASEVEFLLVPGAFTERGGGNDNAWSGEGAEGRADFVGFGFGVTRPNMASDVLPVMRLPGDTRGGVATELSLNPRRAFTVWCSLVLASFDNRSRISVGT